jgi:NTE family protein
MAKQKMIELALQGGGAHGAFTWGVLDRLLEDDRIVIEGICGTSAGAMNAVVVADGLDVGGKEGARQALERFWSRVSQASLFSPFKRTWLDRLLGRWTLDFSPGYMFFDTLSRLVSPYQLNPFNINPLRDLISSLVDFEHVRHAEGIKAVRGGHQRSHRQAKDFPASGNDRGHGAGFRLPAFHFPGGGDRG